jgi:hypothetical protein
VTPETNLSQRMRRLAKSRTDLPENWMKTADDFDAATLGFYSVPQTVDTKKFLGCFARARRMWCEATGESLV